MLVGHSGAIGGRSAGASKLASGRGETEAGVDGTSDWLADEVGWRVGCGRQGAVSVCRRAPSPVARPRPRPEAGFEPDFKLVSPDRGYQISEAALAQKEMTMSRLQTAVR